MAPVPITATLIGPAVSGLGLSTPSATLTVHLPAVVADPAEPLGPGITKGDGRVGQPRERRADHVPVQHGDPAVCASHGAGDSSGEPQAVLVGPQGPVDRAQLTRM